MTIFKILLQNFLLLICINQIYMQTLSGFNVDQSKITTSGLGSGASMAGQLHIAHSALISGAAIIGGPPYYCAANSLNTAMSTCMSSAIGPSLSGLTSKINEFSSKKLIDDTSNLANDRVYIYSGTKDTTVRPTIAKVNEQLYSTYTSPSNIKSVYNIDSVNAMITDNYGTSCGVSNSYHINNCNYNQAYDILNHMYPNDNILKPGSSQKATGSLYTFDQTEFFPSGSSAISLDNTGYLYVPNDCEGNNQCKLHVVFHACNQQAAKIGDIFVSNAGFNQVADLNKIIILYPQARSSVANINSCFDWWGYTNANYANKNGLQIQAVRAMIERLTQKGNGGQVTVSTTAKPQTTQASSTSTAAPTSASSGQTTRPQVTSTGASATTTTRAPSTGDILDSLDIDKSQITVSGISSGGSMASQLHIAFSTIFNGVGTIAGPPYYCAVGSMMTALTACMGSAGTSASTITNKIDSYQSQKVIDDINNIRNDKVYIYSGKKDTTVAPAVAKLNEQVYQKYVDKSNIKTVYDINSVHGLITDFYGAKCDATGTYYINNCDYNQAFDLLKHIHPNENLVQPEKNAKYTGKLYEFNQKQFLGSNSKISMDSAGYLYVPQSCMTQKCKLHVALHGCVQQKNKLGNIFAANTGYNQVADLNNFVILYPQAIENSAVSNPNGCWDWWGYSDANYANKNGMQMKAILAMVERIAKL